MGFDHNYGSKLLRMMMSSGGENELRWQLCGQHESQLHRGPCRSRPGKFGGGEEWNPVAYEFMFSNQKMAGSEPRLPEAACRR